MLFLFRLPSRACVCANEEKKEAEVFCTQVYIDKPSLFVPTSLLLQPPVVSPPPLHHCIEPISAPGTMNDLTRVLLYCIALAVFGWMVHVLPFGVATMCFFAVTVGLQCAAEALFSDDQEILEDTEDMEHKEDKDHRWRNRAWDALVPWSLIWGATLLFLRVAPSQHRVFGDWMVPWLRAEALHLLRAVGRAADVPRALDETDVVEDMIADVDNILRRLDSRTALPQWNHLSSFLPPDQAPQLLAQWQQLAQTKEFFGVAAWSSIAAALTLCWQPRLRPPSLPFPFPSLWVRSQSMSPPPPSSSP